MRDILFKGRSSATKEWFEGDLNHHDNKELLDVK